MNKFHMGMLVGMAHGAMITIFVLGWIDVYRAERRKSNDKKNRY